MGGDKVMGLGVRVKVKVRVRGAVIVMTHDLSDPKP